MTPAIQSICVTIANAIVIVGVLIWSGNNVGDALYRKHLIEFDRVLIASANLEQTQQFYTKVLGLPTTSVGGAKAIKLSPRSQMREFRPGKFIELVQAEESPSRLRQVIVINVRNDLPGLHRKIAERSGRVALSAGSSHDARADLPVVLPPDLAGAVPAPFPPGTVSEILQVGGSKMFAVCDPDGNILLFVKRRRI